MLLRYIGRGPPVMQHAKYLGLVVSAFLLALLWRNAGLVVGPLLPSVRNTFTYLVCAICNSTSFHSFILKVCIIEGVHLIFCAHFMIIFTFLGVLNYIFRWCLVCVICNSNSFHSFILKLCIMIVHAFKMCTSYFMHI